VGLEAPHRFYTKSLAWMTGKRQPSLEPPGMQAREVWSVIHPPSAASANGMIFVVKVTIRIPAENHETSLAMTAFYFDVAGVLIPDRFASDNALNVFRELGERYGFSPEVAHVTYAKLQPSLDLGVTRLSDFCAALGVAQLSFERDWLAMHPVDSEVIGLIERLLEKGHSVGLATNFCRDLLDLLIADTSALSRLVVCCSSDIGLAKPSAEFFNRASKIIGSSEIVFVDDRSVNVDAARRFGWTAIPAADGWLARFQETYLASPYCG
jgi:HAD superfamily hydrolase (TIGR01509 family)